MTDPNVQGAWELAAGI